MLGAIAAALPRPKRSGWIVTLDTLLRWHRRRIARHWTQPSRRRGRPPSNAEIGRLIIDMATDNPTWGYRHAVQVHGSLEKVATSVELFLPDDGKDVTDHLNNGQDISELIAMRVADLRALCAATTAQDPPTHPQRRPRGP